MAMILDRFGTMRKLKTLPLYDGNCIIGLGQPEAQTETKMSRSRFKETLAISVWALFGACTAAQAQGHSLYSVDGLAIGDSVHFESQTYKEYRCVPSRYEGLTFCRRTKQVQKPQGKTTIGTTLAHRSDGEVVYISQTVDPAFFQPGDVETEITRLSSRFGGRPDLTQMQGQTLDAATSLIAV